MRKRSEKVVLVHIHFCKKRSRSESLRYRPYKTADRKIHFPQFRRIPFLWQTFAIEVLSAHIDELELRKIHFFREINQRHTIKGNDIIFAILVFHIDATELSGINIIPILHYGGVITDHFAFHDGFEEFKIRFVDIRFQFCL